MLRFSFLPADGILDAFVKAEFETKGAYRSFHESRRATGSESGELLIETALPDLALYSHQMSAVRRVIGEFDGRAILADEVGLGKTIEAGAIIKEYVLRGLVRRALVLVPPSLLDQWSEELAARFDLGFSIPKGPRGWEAPFLLASLDTAKRERFAATVRAKPYDIVVVDEAHRLRNRATSAWRFVNSIQRRYFLLLTATPVHNDLRELYNLVTLVLPGQLSTYARFKKDFVASPQVPRDLPGLRLRLERVLVRSNRRRIMLSLPRRRVTTVSLKLTGPEQAFYDGVEGLLREAVQRGQDRKQLLSYVVLLREAASSAGAASATLARMCARRKRDAPEAARMRELILLGREVETTAKLRRLLDLCAEVNDKLIVFTEFRATQAMILRALAGKGVAVAAFDGSMRREERMTAVARFREECRVLVSTEAGGEGQNWQFCSRVVNFDLPWNPMRVEQRIGRVHRLGQTRDVEIVNFATEATIEEHVCRLLTDKIALFESVVGELDVILARATGRGFEATLTDLVLKAGDDALLAEGVAAFGESIARARDEYEAAQDWNDALFTETPGEGA